MIKVLIVEDSLVVQELLVHILSTDPEIKVIGTANNGEEALEFLSSNTPDVITMDIIMPIMDGFETTRKIMETKPVPIVIVSENLNTNEAEKTFRALECGAVAVLKKPKGLGKPNFDNVAKELVNVVKTMSEVKVVRRWSRSKPLEKSVISKISTPIKRASQKIELVAIGASTGGPPVLKTILSALPKEFPVPVLIVQHITVGFTEGFVDWLRQITSMKVQIAVNNDSVLAGNVYVAPDNHQMLINKNKKIILINKKNDEKGHCPSVASMYSSVIENFGGNAIGVLLTGMGKDGAEELKLMKDAGSITIAQDKESSVVHGMPGEAIKLNAATHILSPEKIAATLNEITNKNN